MSNFDVTAIGVAFVDVVANVTEDFLQQYSLTKGQGNVLPISVLREIRKNLMDSRVIPGGTAANAMATVASLGGRAAFIGKACTDTMGEKFREAFDHCGVKSCVPLVPFDRDIDRATARCLVMVTPDHDRTFAFNMGICEEIEESDIDTRTILESGILFIEGQMLVSRRARQAVAMALKTAKDAGVKVAFNMHDLNFRAVAVQEVIETIRTQADILIGNEREIRGCFEIDRSITDMDAFMNVLTDRRQILAMTRGARGACIFSHEGIATVASENHQSVVDSTGAGDAFAGGFLFGLSQGLSLPAAGKLAALSAAEIIRIWGGRPEKSLAAELKSYLDSVRP
ncbi:MAG: adenosine kinase [Alphaproteobacteria bacterium]|nr:adenosine kinase [Alphaproteobacteria bacterium]